MCDNAPEGVSPDRLQGDCFEHFFPNSIWEAKLLHHRAIPTGLPGGLMPTMFMTRVKL
jgi:hypothetical protein